MNVTKTYCDRCGIEIKDNETIPLIRIPLFLQIGARPNKRVQSNHQPLEICYWCTRKLIKWFQRPFTGAEYLKRYRKQHLGRAM